MRRLLLTAAGLLALALSLPAQPSEIRGSWSATAGTRNFIGSWTASLKTSANVSWGTWRLLDTSGKILAEGVWSVRRAGEGWQGSWRADSSGRSYGGTWKSDVKLPVSERFADLLDAALKEVVSGTWRAGQTSGAWSLRTIP